MDMGRSPWIYDWNQVEPLTQPQQTLELEDQTLRDGLQSPSVRNPGVDDKLELLHLMAALGIDSADLGLPAAGPQMFDDVLRLCQEIADHRLPIEANAAARTVVADLEPLVEISQRTGVPVTAATFIGSSPIRLLAEGWDLDFLLRCTERTVTFCVEHGLGVKFVTEDTTRGNPEDLRRLYTTAIDYGARRLCIADTVGHATPGGARAVVRFVRRLADASGEPVAVDWHGHRDRDLSVANSLAAAEAGAHRLHGTGLGIGERTGNTPLDTLLVNLTLLGWSRRPLDRLPDYCQLVARSVGLPIPRNYPVVGPDAFRTATGVHAAAIFKARSTDDPWLAERVYSGVPAALVGRRQQVEVGPLSGNSNVYWWLEEQGLPTSRRELVEALLTRAKASTTVLEEAEMFEVCRRHGVDPDTAAPADRGAELLDATFDAAAG